MEPCTDCGRSGETTPYCRACDTLRDRGVRVSPMTEGDLELVLAWRSNPLVYRHFRRQDGPLSWDDHVAWFESRAPERHDFVVTFEGRRVGVVSLTEDDEVSIYLGDVSARGNGVASAVLRWLCDRFVDRIPLYAEVQEENEASRLLFERCGFERRDEDDDWILYAYEA